MSIIRSTKAGKSAVKLTKEYLFSRGWISNETLMFPPNKHHNKNYIIVQSFNNVSDDKITFEIRLSTFQKVDTNPHTNQTKWLHTIPIETVCDLELVENFWYTKNQNKKLKYKKQLLTKATKTTPVSYGYYWEVSHK